MISAICPTICMCEVKYIRKFLKASFTYPMKDVILEKQIIIV
jgi:hypothetical protein